jgi:hypothetical protein
MILVIHLQNPEGVKRQGKEVSGMVILNKHLGMFWSFRLHITNIHVLAVYGTDSCQGKCKLCS